MSDPSEHPEPPEQRAAEHPGPSPDDVRGEEPASAATGEDVPVREIPAEDAKEIPDPGAWAEACAEDLARERRRRREEQRGQQPGSAAEELRRLLDAVTDTLSGVRAPFVPAAAQETAQQVMRQMVDQARAAVEPVVERNPQVFDHLAAAGSELLAAYRTAVAAQERRWARDDRDGRGKPGSGSGGGEHIDLD